VKDGSRASALAVTAACLLALAALAAAFRPHPPVAGTGPAASRAAAPEYHVPSTDGTYVADGFCAGCHATPPHARSAGSAMLNYHVTRIHCLVCHGQGFLSGADVRRAEGVLRPLPGGSPPDEGRERGWREAALRQGPCFPAGPGCADCHRPEGLLDLRGLGYEPGRAGHLERLEGYLTRTAADPWFFPSLR
jgi:hypothetical protein